MNIVIVCNFDPAGYGIKLKKAIERHSEHNCRCFCLSPHPFGYEKDIYIDEVVDFEEIKIILSSADVFQFIIYDWDATFPFGPIKWKEYIIGKKVTIIHCGEPFILNPWKQAEKYKKYGIKVIPTWDRDTEFLEKENYALVAPICSILSKEEASYMLKLYSSNHNTIRVCHTPSSNIRKGTFVFEKVMREICKKIDNVEYVVLSKMNYQRTLEEMARSDIIFDEIWIEGIWGHPLLEGFSLGKPVLVYLQESTINWWKKVCGCEDIPLVNVNPNNLKENLIKLINDKALREELGQRAKEWIYKYWDSKQAVDKLIDFYNQLPPLNELQ